jgi:hypothetical protein
MAIFFGRLNYLFTVPYMVLGSRRSWGHLMIHGR